MTLGHRHFMGGCIMTSHVVKYLPLNVNQQCASSNTEKIRLCPVISELFLHQDHPQCGILCTANTTSWLETNLKMATTISHAEQNCMHYTRPPSLSFELTVN